jgi:hypothetical protein
MKPVSINPSDFTKDEIYIAFEYLNSKFDRNKIEKLEQLNKMFIRMKDYFVNLNIQTGCYIDKNSPMSLQWNARLKEFFILYENDTWNILASPSDKRLYLETILPEAIEYFADNINHSDDEV